jgi:hypothetical protein
MSRLFFLSFVLLSLPFGALAHSSGTFYETVVDGVHIDVGYSSAAPAVGEAVIFDFTLDPDQPLVPRYTDVWVRVESEDGSVVLATAVHNAEFGGPRMSYVFPRAGNFTISMRYENGNTTLAEASFPITVVPDTKSGGIPWYAFLLGGIVIGAAGTYVYTHRKKPAR